MFAHPKKLLICYNVLIKNRINKRIFYTLDSGCHPDGTDILDADGKCHCNQGFSGDLCVDFCPEGEFGTPPYCQGSIFI